MPKTVVRIRNDVLDVVDCRRQPPAAENGVVMRPANLIRR